MLFNTPAFIAFFALFYVVFHLCLRKNEHKLWAITIGSALFYATFDYRFIGILLITGVADYTIARAIGITSDDGRKRRLVILSVTLNLLMLAFFKYTNFFLTNVESLLGMIGVGWSKPTLHVILPLGISFYIFQSISYILDVYRGSFQPRKELHEFVASLMFFPHLIAGPIVRASSMLPQFEKITAPSWPMISRGFALVAMGLFKKTIADLVAPSVNAAFASHTHGALDSWTGALGFTLQIYCDFAGYTDMAIGFALLLGFELPLNFRLPYIATSPADFWARWHISLSTWLRDYLFTPLVMRFRSHPYLCMMTTWFLAGLWHGADWNFVAYGVYHGSLLVAWNWIGRRVPDSWGELPERHWSYYLAMVFTFYLVVIGFVMFRAPTWDVFFGVLHGMHVPSVASITTWDAALTFALIVFALVLTHFVDYLVLEKQTWLERPFVLWILCALAFAFSFAFGGKGVTFIYFQF